MNTPEQTMNGVDVDDDNYKENKLSNRQQLIEQLQTQLNHQRMRRTRPRNYVRILSESNTPAYWYKAPSNNRSVYFYDPNYQKYVQEQTNSPPKIKSNINVNKNLILLIHILLILVNFFSIIQRSRTSC